MAACIQGLESEFTHIGESVSDDTALYRISGWAVKSVIQHRQNALRKASKATETKEKLQLLTALKCTQASKSTLPIGAGP